MLSQVCGSEGERAQAVDQAVLSESAWDAIRQNLPSVAPVSAFVAGVWVRTFHLGDCVASGIRLFLVHLEACV